jgi:tetratricopeptide (TPR) repeat protein
VRYVFKHALIQDTAYQSLLKSTRQLYHQQIARVLEERFPDTSDSQPELLAHHCTEAGLTEQAIPYWQRAGEQAIRRSANVEAIRYLTKALELLTTLPDTPERARQELSLQIALGPALASTSTRGYVAPEVESSYLRARELCRQMGETPQLFPILQGLATFYSVRAEFSAAQELGTQLLHVAQRAQDPALLLRAHIALQSPLFWQGEFTAAYEHAEQGIALYGPLKQHTHVPQALAQDPGVMCLIYAALALSPLGYPDQALKRAQEAVTLAQELSQPFSVAYAHFSATAVCSLCQEVQLTQQHAGAAVSVATEYGFGFPRIVAEFWQGWALMRQGQKERGLSQMRQSLTALQVIG